MIYKTDYHVHTNYSDGKAAPEEYIAAAISEGLNEIGFSEHLTLFKNKQDWFIDTKRVPEYIAYVKRLKRRFRDIKIRVGLEVDFFPGKEKELNDFLSQFELDYVIGSVHYLGERTVDSGPEFYEGKNIDELYKSYFNCVSEALASGLFDIIGHCDLIRIYNFRPSADPEPLYRQLAVNLKKYGVVLEINTNGKNRPVADFYPDRRFLHIFFEENVPVCVNSDAHMPSRVGQYFKEVYQLLKNAGYKEMVVFEKRERSIIPIV